MMTNAAVGEAKSIQPITEPRLMRQLSDLEKIGAELHEKATRIEQFLNRLRNPGPAEKAEKHGDSAPMPHTAEGRLMGIQNTMLLLNVRLSEAASDLDSSV